MYDNLPSYFSQRYDPFCGSLPDIVAVIAGIKPLAELSLSPGKEESYQNFIKFIAKRVFNAFNWDKPTKDFSVKTLEQLESAQSLGDIEKALKNHERS